MKLLYQGGYNEQERAFYKRIVYTNTIQSMRSELFSLETDELIQNSREIIEAMPRWGVQISPQNEVHRSVVLSLPERSEGELLHQDIQDAVLELSKDPGVKEAISRSREFQLHDSAFYFFNEIERLFNPDYVPTNLDILRSRENTAGIAETAFKVDNQKYKMLDVGQQWPGHKKWMHCFEHVDALFFLVNLNDYDQMLYDESGRVTSSIFSMYTMLMMISLEQNPGSTHPVRLYM